MAWKSAASAGNRYERTAAAAAAVAACSEGYEGLRGTGRRVFNVGSASLGRGRLYAYLESQLATVASYIACATYNQGRTAYVVTEAPRMVRLLSTSIQRYAG